MSKKLDDVVITSALRTPIGTYKGSLKDLSADRLGALAIKEAVHKSNLKSEEIDEVIMGHVLTSGLGQNPARQASIHAGIPVSKPAHIVNQVCGSGLRSIVSGFQSIKLEANKIIVSGGQENMSRAPHSLFYRENKKLDAVSYTHLTLPTNREVYISVVAVSLTKQTNDTTSLLPRT